MSNNLSIPEPDSGVGAPATKKSAYRGPLLPAAAAALLKAFDPSEEDSALMVAAGVEVLWQSGAVEGRLGSDVLLVAEIFQAMLRTRF
jgi:hypothetical protein